MFETTNNPGMGTPYIRCGIGHAAKAHPEGGGIIEHLPYCGPAWLVFSKDDEPMLVIALPPQYWWGLN